MNAVNIYNLHRAIYGLYPLTTRFKNEKMKLFDAFLHDSEEEKNYKIAPGSIQYCSKTNAVKVLCKDRKYIYFRSLRIVGKREISAIDFYNGYIKNTPLEKRSSIVCQC